ncbi:allantoate amidohydrolase [Myceligenerans sp. TRM 65318]|uniref:Allantoate amidohydrolase n=2 Tax=Myceligenerans pegani TaxID=2776917 RepID=A0ABR9N0A4_9MICO|nr:allantoate amidohydrolase [Myceligenerans sp. TRM 65318]MBE3019340.1 allantoate amidohydrolase [Myceligenerans sp. TRM 65318]
MWRDLEPLGLSARTGGYFRQPFLTAEREAAAWFEEAARARGLRVESDGFGNTVAWWHPVDDDGGRFGATDPGALSRRGNAVLTGSHLDSVLDGGAFDGPLGVVSALAAIDVLRDRGITPRVPLGVGVFVEEEGSRFGLACLGSRLATGQISWADARELRDRDGIALGDVIAGDDGAGRHDAEPGSPAGTAPASDRDIGDRTAGGLLDGVSCFVELHCEQGRDLVLRDDAPVGLASAIWPHGRYRFDFCGHADHAGATRMADRHDPMLTYAATSLAADAAARDRDGVGDAIRRATFGRLDVRPGGTNAIPSRVSAWLDARASTDEELADLLSEVERAARDRAAADGTTLDVTAESVSGEVIFDRGLTSRLAAALGATSDRDVAERGAAERDAVGRGAADRRRPRALTTGALATSGNAGIPIIPTGAGHDAGILQQAGIPTAMLFVRNETGVSHSPEESITTADALAGVDALADVLAELITNPPAAPHLGEAAR